MEEVIQYVPNLYATFWALIPPLVAIILALITKEVYSSLFVGIVIGGLFYGNIFQSGFSFEKSVLHIFEDGVHGLALCNEVTANEAAHINKSAEAWFGLVLTWLKKYIKA